MFTVTFFINFATDLTTEMKSILKYMLVLAIGTIIGIAGMYAINPKDRVVETIVKVETTEKSTTSSKKKNKVKTVDSSDIDSSDIDSSDIDSTEFTITDDSLGALLNADTLIIDNEIISPEEDEEYFEIVSERLIAKSVVEVKIIQPDSLDASDLLNLKADSYSKSLAIEFWESPLDLIGYELNRSRLKLFGFNAEELVQIERAYDSEKLTVQIGTGNNSLVLILEKSPKFNSIILK